MEAVLYSLIRHHQAERSHQVGHRVVSFRLWDLEALAARFPSLYPEYLVSPERVEAGVRFAREAAEIQPPLTGGRDDLIWLSMDHDSSQGPPPEASGG